MFQHGDNQGPNMRAVFDELKRRGLAYDGMPVRDHKDGVERGFMAVAEKASGYECRPQDSPEQAAAGMLAGLGVPLPIAADQADAPIAE